MIHDLRRAGLACLLLLLAVFLLFLIGRNGMHRYNNQDHSMLTAMRAVEHIVQGLSSKDHIWDVNAGEEYHEEN